MDTVWRAVFRQRFFSPSVSRCAGTAQSGKGAASAFNRAERDAIGDYANRVGDGLQNRAWLGSTPAIASHRIRISGTDTCRRSCRASPSAKVHLTSESAELRTRVEGTDRKPTLVSDRAQIRHGWMRAPPSDCPGRTRWSRNAGNAFRPHLCRDSSVGQSGRLVSGRSRVRIPLAAPSRMRQRHPPHNLSSLV